MMRWIKTLFLGIGLAALVLCAPGSAVAQVAPRLVFIPTASEVPLGTNFSLELAIEDGINLNAMDVTVNYDANILSLTGWSYGDYFSNLATVSEVNQPGTLRVAATQLASPFVSGDGVLLKMSFYARGTGLSALVIEKAELAGGTGEKILPDHEDGSVWVTLEASYTPTPTATRTPMVYITPPPTSMSPVVSPVTPTPTSTPYGFVASPTAPTSLFPSSLPGTEQPEGESTWPVQAPGSEAALMTETALENPMPTPGSSHAGMEATAQLDEPEETEGAPIEEAQDGIETLDESQEDQPLRRVLNIALWALLIVSVAALLVMALILILRRRKRERDLLL